MKKKILIILSILVLIFTGITLYLTREQIIVFYKLITNGEVIKSYIEGFGAWAALIFFIFQVLQVVIFFIPGEVIQAAGGYIFGTLEGTLLSFFGIAVGSAALFYICKKFGKKLVQKFVPKDMYDGLEKVLNSPKFKLILVILFLVPGAPKDSLIMVCALSNITMKNFIIFSMLGRIPALAVSSFMGANLAQGKIVTVIVVGVIALIACVLGVIFRKDVFKYIEKL
ncbi:TVP38/TMEM64 family protein [Clostridium sp. LIBA-8841]|uniref:TVP38/TMEM64 family protein n=1 Tax=Clostridium sp. LIBA-8841 TaxID=2987530 RepID=UPI002AC6BDAC|nr:TVP38/TMEM64 family protein [Clostridium sp. LIBA-8841]MDZ5255186.1 TVP38/TMEM64 family protein [Clostridium sp. LIBA-8841]